MMHPFGVRSTRRCRFEVASTTPRVRTRATEIAIPSNLSHLALEALLGITIDTRLAVRLSCDHAGVTAALPGCSRPALGHVIKPGAARVLLFLLALVLALALALAAA